MKKGPFKMKGFTGFGNSPVKAKSEAAENLLKAVPDKESYDKLSDIDKKGFDKAAKKAGLPTKKSPNKLVNKNRKLKKTDKKIKKKQTKEIKERLSKLSTEELMKMREAKKSPAKAGQTAGQIVRRERLMN